MRMEICLFELRLLFRARPPSRPSSVVGPTRQDFDGIMDEFLGNYTKPGKRTSKKTKAQTGLEQLEEIRKGLGPARIRGRN